MSQTSQHVELNPENYEAVKLATVASLRAGDVVCMAMDGAYVYAAYAFNIDAVYAIHRMRGAQPGTQLQIVVGDVKTAYGIASDLNGSMLTLAEKFWPGPLTLILTPQRGLAWDLGDARELNEFALRVPHRKFIRDVLNSTGPVAIASASVAGMEPLTSINYVQGNEVALYVDEGELEGWELSSVVKRSSQGSNTQVSDRSVSDICQLIREGALSFADLTAVVPFTTQR